MSACNLGMGCDEAGVCFAEAHGKPDECGVATIATKFVPVIPTEAQWGGLARDLIQWLHMSGPTGAKLHDHLERLGRNVPPWLLELIPDVDHCPSKGDVAYAIYRLMVEAAPEGEKVRHLKTGGNYEVLSRKGKVQSRRPLNDMDELVSYRGADGQVWHRPPDEMNDGRFEPVT